MPEKDLEKYFADIPKPKPEEIVFEWRSLSRPFKQHKRQHYSTIIIIVFLISLILFFAGQFLPIGVVIAVTFVYYVMSTVAPGEVLNKITTLGLRQEDQLYYWEELGRFWFNQRYGQKMLQVEVARFPYRLTLMLDTAEETQLEEILSRVLLKEKPKATAFEKASAWLQEKIALE